MNMKERFPNIQALGDGCVSTNWPVLKSEAKDVLDRIKKLETVLRYVIECRNVACLHKHPGPDEFCAKCKADAALI